MTRSLAAEGNSRVHEGQDSEVADVVEATPRQRGPKPKKPLKAALRRISLYLSRSLAEDLEELSTEMGGSEADIVRQGITLRKWMQGVRDRGAKIYVEDSEGGRREVELLW